MNNKIDSIHLIKENVREMAEKEPDTILLNKEAII